MDNLTKEEKQRLYEKEWRENNPDRVRYNRYKSNARTFVRHHATEEDMKELMAIYEKSKIM